MMILIVYIGLLVVVYGANLLCRKVDLRMQPIRFLLSKIRRISDLQMESGIQDSAARRE